MGVSIVKKWSTGVVFATMMALGSYTLTASGSTTFSYTVTELKPLPGDNNSAVYSINDLGQAVGSSDSFNGRGSGDYHALLWENGRVRNLGTLGGNDSFSSAINNKGQVVGSSQTSSGDYHAFLWEKGQMKDLGTLGGKTSSASGINYKGQVVGYSQTSSGDVHAFLWENGQMKDLGTLGGKTSHAYGINYKGQVVGDSQTSSGESHATLWEKDTTNKVKIQDLGTLGGGYSAAYGINNKGQVVGMAETQKEYLHCVLWSEGTIKDISPRLKDGGGFGAECLATSINNRGTLVGYYNLDGADINPFVRFNSSKALLEKLLPVKPGGFLLNVEGINNKGQIVLNGLDQTDKAYLLTPTWVTQ